MIPILILAAGRSSRMKGRDKLLEHVQGEPLLARVAKRAETVGPIVVTLPRIDHPRASVLPETAKIVPVSGDMSDSLKAGIKALPDTATGVIVLLADMPDITANDIAKIRDTALETGAPVVRGATRSGQSGHPIYFAASLFAKFQDLIGDRGAAPLIKDHKDDVVLVTLDGDRSRLDLDTPADWATYRAR